MAKGEEKSGILGCYNLGSKGVVLSKSPFHGENGELASAQNAAPNYEGAVDGISKRLGMAKINASAANGAIYSFANVPLSSSDGPQPTGATDLLYLLKQGSTPTGRRGFVGAWVDQTADFLYPKYTQDQPMRSAYYGGYFFYPVTDAGLVAQRTVKRFDGTTVSDAFSLPATGIAADAAATFTRILDWAFNETDLWVLALYNGATGIQHYVVFQVPFSTLTATERYDTYGTVPNPVYVTSVALWGAYLYMLGRDTGTGVTSLWRLNTNLYTRDDIFNLGVAAHTPLCVRASCTTDGPIIWFSWRQAGTNRVSLMTYYPATNTTWYYPWEETTGVANGCEIAHVDGPFMAARVFGGAYGNRLIYTNNAGFSFSSITMDAQTLAVSNGVIRSPIAGVVTGAYFLAARGAAIASAVTDIWLIIAQGTPTVSVSNAGNWGGPWIGRVGV